MKNQAVLSFTVAAVTSALVWASSPWLLGHREPWDANFPFYLVALVIAVAVAGALTPNPMCAHYLDSFIGQLEYEIIFWKVGQWFVLGAVFLVGYCLVFVAAASFAGYLRQRVTGDV